MFGEVVGGRLSTVERFAWHPADGASPRTRVGSVHLWFDSGLGLHVDGASDWTLRCAVSRPGDDTWMAQYRYQDHGRWLARDATAEAPFRGLAGTVLTAVTTRRNPAGEAIALVLGFGSRDVTLELWEGEIRTPSS